MIKDIIEPDLQLDSSYKPNLILSLDDATALKRVLFHHHIAYDDLEANKVVARVIKFVDENSKK